MQRELGVTQRRACRVIGQPRSTQRYRTKVAEDEQHVRQAVIETACKYGRYGYRIVAGLLRGQCLVVNHKRVERIWREEGLKLPKKQRKKGRLWLHDGSCIRLRPAHRNHVWAYDFLHDQTADGRAFRILAIVDEFSRECLALEVARRFSSIDVIEQLARLMALYGIPEHVRSDNSPEFIAKIVRNWLTTVGSQPTFIQPGSPWENGYVESFNGKFRDAVLDAELFYTLIEAKVIIENWRRHYNEVRPHSSLGYRPPAPNVIVPANSVPTLTTSDQPIWLPN